MKLQLLLCIVLLFVPGLLAEDWAVIVAGSNGWDNYRHQADACHAFQVVHHGGIPSSHIIMMYFDDIAANSMNPFPGKIYNHPTKAGFPGIDVYAGCQKDYTGNDVTAQNFLNVITGNTTAMKGIGSGKVLKSGPKDRVFLNFVDHGASGLLAFPSGGFLYAQPLHQALLQMHKSKMYQKLVFYVEACESGSMFASSLPKNIGIYATTAANPTESSWGTFCPPQDNVNGTSMNTCLGDTYSVHWMQDADRASRISHNQTLEVQYKIVKKETTQSHVMQYGDESWTDSPINDFEGQPHVRGGDAHDEVAPEQAEESEDAQPNRHIGLRPPHPYSARRIRSRPVPRVVEAVAEGQGLSLDDEARSVIASSAVDSRDIGLHLAYYRYLRAKSVEESHQFAAELQGFISRRVQVDNTFMGIARAVTGSAAKAQDLMAMLTPKELPPLACMQTVMSVYEHHCGRMDDYSLKYVRVFANLCHLMPVDSIAHAVEQARCVPAN